MGLPARDPVPLLLVIFFPSDASHGRRRGTWPTGDCVAADDDAGDLHGTAAAVDDSAAANDLTRIPPKRAVREGVFGRPARRRHRASNSLVGVTGGPALRAGSYQGSGRALAGAGREPTGPAHHVPTSSGIRREQRADDMRASGRAGMSRPGAG